MHAPIRRVTPDQLAERIIDSLRELDRRDLTVMAVIVGDLIRAARRIGRVDQLSREGAGPPPSSSAFSFVRDRHPVLRLPSAPSPTHHDNVRAASNAMRDDTEL